jgi:pimeloyl-ACP methyl ester carboxylesterase
LGAAIRRGPSLVVAAHNWGSLGVVSHLVHQHGRGPALLTHGWPGSFCEYLDLLPLLTDPGTQVCGTGS